MKMKKYSQNPILTPQNVKPSREDFKVDGVFNCGAIKIENEYILLCRIAESFINDDDTVVKIPVVVNKMKKDEIECVIINKKENSQYDYGDSRSVWTNESGSRKIIYLTSLSHFRIARSEDGLNFSIDDVPTIKPRAFDEEWGIEDPRITEINGTYYINYTSVTRNGAATSLITTLDFKTFERKGIIFAPENKDVTIFPQKIKGSYYTFNRPVPCAIGAPDMWLAKSDNLIHWGEQLYFYGVTDKSSWENGRIGGGAVPFLTEKGWIKIYHAADSNNKYCLGAFLLDKDEPSKILGKTEKPILEPTEEYEINGFFGNVVFTCGCIVVENTVNIYYGAADDKVCLAQIEVDDLLHLIIG
jgi:beta-1,2-mannobiose phosphorylase / 1,2-beta-oligomannan phosphorylase